MTCSTTYAVGTNGRRSRTRARLGADVKVETVRYYLDVLPVKAARLTQKAAVPSLGGRSLFPFCPPNISEGTKKGRESAPDQNPSLSPSGLMNMPSSGRKRAEDAKSVSEDYMDTNTTNNICANCGCIDEDLITLIIDGEERTVCADCAHDLGYEQCDDCGEWVLAEDLTPVDESIRWRRTRYVCNDCLDDYTRCDDCNDYFSDNCMETDDTGTALCERCFEDTYTRCDDCGRIIHYDDTYYANDDDGPYCEYCVDEHRRGRNLHDYGYKPEPDFKFRKSELDKLAKLRDRYVSPYEAQKSELTFGVELEVDKGDDADELCDELTELDQPIYMKHDGSLGCEGVEIVTHPCSLAYHQYELRWAEIARLCKSHDYKSHDAGTCGLHIHVGLAALADTAYDRRTVEAKLILLAGRFQQQLTKFSRRESYQLEHWASFAHVDVFDDMDDAELRSAAIRSSDHTRYMAVNILPSATVEFRLFRGTLKRETLIASIQLVNNLVKYALSHTIRECAFEACWLDVINLEQFKELSTYAAKYGLI